MGINIFLLNVDTDKPVNLNQEPHWWDSNKYSGDREFVNSEEIDWSYLQHDDETLQRPSDFNSTRLWINEHIPLANQVRLTMAVDAMERDSDLWFLVSR